MTYIPYLKAAKLLANRLEATSDEIAAWLWIGPNEGGIAAYVNADGPDSPRRFYFDLGSGYGFDYLSPLMACWFSEEDITNFQPDERFITGQALIKRWEEEPGIRPEAFIRAKIDESRLLALHPIFGDAQGSFPDEEPYPSLERGLFVLSHVEKIEEDEDFDRSELEKNPALLTITERNEYLQKAANDLAHQWSKDGRRKFSKRQLAICLKKRAPWSELSEGLIERNFKKQW